MKATAVIGSAILLIAPACDSPGGAPAAGPPLDSLQMLADSLEKAWDEEDAALLDWCLAQDFQRNLPAEDWDDYDGDGIVDTCWSEGLELLFAGAFFEGTSTVGFDLAGDSAAAWPGDPTGGSWVIERSFILTACPGPAPEDTLTAWGTAVIVCGSDASGILRVRQLWSAPDPESDWSWTDLLCMPWTCGHWTLPEASR